MTRTGFASSHSPLALAVGRVQLAGERIAPEIVGEGPAGTGRARSSRELGAPFGDQLVLIAPVVAAAARGRVAVVFLHALTRPP